MCSDVFERISHGFSQVKVHLWNTLNTTWSKVSEFSFIIYMQLGRNNPRKVSAITSCSPQWLLQLPVHRPPSRLLMQEETSPPKRDFLSPAAESCMKSTRNACFNDDNVTQGLHRRSGRVRPTRCQFSRLLLVLLV